jgi:hypothetical protein
MLVWVSNNRIGYFYFEEDEHVTTLFGEDNIGLKIRLANKQQTDLVIKADIPAIIERVRQFIWEHPSQGHSLSRPPIPSNFRFHFKTNEYSTEQRPSIKIKPYCPQDRTQVELNNQP